MRRKLFLCTVLSGLCISFSACPMSGAFLPEEANSGAIADHSIVSVLREGRIPETAIQTAINTLNIGYGHTSHGSQLVSGMSGLVSFANDGGLGTAYSENLFRFSADGSVGLHLFEGSSYSEGYLELDCGYNDWVDETEAYLEDYPDCNVIIWSWCGQVGNFDEEGLIDHYLDPMSELEETYPDVVFVYMTGHLDGEGEGGAVHRSNEQIRQYCRDNGKWLFDFADIESHGPDGVYYGDRLADDGCNYDADEDGVLETDGGDPGTPTDGDANWALDWQAAYDEGSNWYQCGASHSYAVNANMKAYAAWWLWCRLAGWDGSSD